MKKSLILLCLCLMPVSGYCESTLKGSLTPINAAGTTQNKFLSAWSKAENKLLDLTIKLNQHYSDGPYSSTMALDEKNKEKLALAYKQTESVFDMPEIKELDPDKLISFADSLAASVRNISKSSDAEQATEVILFYSATILRVEAVIKDMLLNKYTHSDNWAAETDKANEYSMKYSTLDKGSMKRIYQIASLTIFACSGTHMEEALNSDKATFRDAETAGAGYSNKLIHQTNLSIISKTIYPKLAESAFQIALNKLSAAKNNLSLTEHQSMYVIYNDRLQRSQGLEAEYCGRVVALLSGTPRTAAQITQ